MRSRSPFLLAAALVVAVVGLAGSGRFGPWAGAESPAGPMAPPALPSVEEAIDGLYDEDGCLRTGPEERDCSLRADQVDEALTEPVAGGPRHLEGFVGIGWLDSPTGTGPRVLPGSVGRGPGPGLTLTGLVRNEGPSVLAEVEVSATLLADDGRAITVVTTTSPVHDIRPGEPVPFTITAEVASTAVAGVRWSSSAVAGGDSRRRALAWTPYWERPAGGEPVDLYLYRDPDDERPHLVFGAVANVGAGGATGPEVVVAWRDAQGRLVSWATAPVRAPSGAPLGTLGPGSAADALLVAGRTPPVGGDALVWVQAT